MQEALAVEEAKRLEILDRYKVLNAPTESQFNELVRLAAQVSQAPMSLVTLVEHNRLSFKGRYGLELTEAPRLLSFCTEAILHPHEPLEVSDASKDCRFAENELVAGTAHIRYYFGAPLVTNDGYALGTLCVLDTRPRRLSTEQKEGVCILSRQAMRELELRTRTGTLTGELEEAQKAVQRMAAIVASTDDSVIAIDVEGMVTSWNRGAERLFGYTAEEMLGRNINVLVPVDGEREHIRFLNTIRRGETLRHYECQRVTRDGRVIDISVTASPIRDHSGRIVGASKFARDITEQKRAREVLQQNRKALQDSEARLRLAVDTAELGMYERDLLTNKVTINETCRRIFGLATELPPPDVARRSVHPEDKERVLAAAARAFDPKLREVCGAEFRIVRADGSICWVAGRGRVIFDESSTPPRPCRFIGVLNDITQRKRLESELQTQTANLERLVQERTAKLAETVTELEHFSYTIAHDMRAPLRAMRSFAKILLAEPTEALEPETRADLLRRISEGALRMDLLITDALDYSQVVRSEMPLKPIEPTPLIRSIVESYPQFHSPKAEIQIAANMPLVLATEAGLTQCFSNLLGNAVKFVEAGVTPRVRVWAETGQSSGTVRIWVEDNGIGISPEYHQKIWQMFQRLSKSYEGTGIGLALVRKVIERMGGQVGVQSEPNQGSRFWVELRCPN